MSALGATGLHLALHDYLFALSCSKGWNWLELGHYEAWHKFSKIFANFSYFPTKSGDQINRYHKFSYNNKLCCFCASEACATTNFFMGGCEKSQNGHGFRFMSPWRLVRTWQHCYPRMPPRFIINLCRVSLRRLVACLGSREQGGKMYSQSA